MGGVLHEDKGMLHNNQYRNKYTMSNFLYLYVFFLICIERLEGVDK